MSTRAWIIAFAVAALTGLASALIAATAGTGWEAIAVVPLILIAGIPTGFLLSRMDRRRTS